MCMDSPDLLEKHIKTAHQLHSESYTLSQWAPLAIIWNAATDLEQTGKMQDVCAACIACKSLIDNIYRAPTMCQGWREK